MKKQLKYIVVIIGLVVALVAVSLVSSDREKKLYDKLIKQDALIEGYRELSKTITHDIDSIQNIRNEKDTIIYDIDTDSLEMLFSRRYGQDSTNNGK